MTNTTPQLDQFFSDQAAGKMNMVTANIIDGIKERLSAKGSITPKQSQWLLERIRKDCAITKAMAAEIIDVMESGTADDQKMAEKRVRSELLERPIEEAAKHFDSLFDGDMVKAVKDLDAITQRLKNKVGL